jgi:hypothetical protein
MFVHVAQTSLTSVISLGGCLSIPFDGLGMVLRDATAAMFVHKAKIELGRSIACFCL